MDLSVITNNEIVKVIIDYAEIAAIFAYFAFLLISTGITSVRMGRAMFQYVDEDEINKMLGSITVTSVLWGALITYYIFTK